MGEGTEGVGGSRFPHPYFNPYVCTVCIPEFLLLLLLAFIHPLRAIVGCSELAISSGGAPAVAAHSGNKSHDSTTPQLEQTSSARTTSANHSLRNC